MKNRERFGAIICVVGMQWGSEGKGSITSYLAPIISMGIRSGGANAGHTVYLQGQKLVMRQIPSAWLNPEAQIVIGTGAIINLETLLAEIELLETLIPLKNRLFIDYRAHVITPDHVKRENESGLAERISSCSATIKEGIGAATAAKVMREESCVQVQQLPELERYATDTVSLINSQLEKDELILLEGSQGFSLSLEFGQFPYVTSRDTSAQALAASVGIATHEFETQVIGVTRTYPIRVHGNSGPFGEDSTELSWEVLAERAGSPEPIEERTSVSRKVRRVATFNKEEFKKACIVNRPTEIALTFADYLDWSLHERHDSSPKLESFINMVEEIAEAPVSLVNTGPNTTMDFDSYRRSILRRI